MNAFKNLKSKISVFLFRLVTSIFAVGFIACGCIIWFCSIIPRSHPVPLWWVFCEIVIGGAFVSIGFLVWRKCKNEALSPDDIRLREMLVILCCIVFAFAIIRCSQRHLMSLPQARKKTPSILVAIKPISPSTTSIAEIDPATISSAIASLCGADPATADRYEARNDALRSIMRERNLSPDDIAALTAWLASTNDVLRVERIAALKNDVMNLLRRQESPPPDFTDTLISIFESEAHPPAVLDYCIQHLGAMQSDIADESLRSRIRALLVKAAGRINQPYAGTALYALAEDASATPAQDAELRRLTHALCAPSANPIARIAAIQLAGERGCAEALPLLRKALAAPRRDAVTDIVCIGSLGLLGDADDIPLLRRFATMGPRYATAAETAIHRIEGREAADGER